MSWQIIPHQETSLTIWDWRQWCEKINLLHLLQLCQRRISLLHPQFLQKHQYHQAICQLPLFRRHQNSRSCSLMSLCCPQNMGQIQRQISWIISKHAQSFGRGPPQPVSNWHPLKTAIPQVRPCLLKCKQNPDIIFWYPGSSRSLNTW